MRNGVFRFAKNHISMVIHILALHKKIKLQPYYTVIHGHGNSISSVPWKTSEIRRKIRRKNKQLLQRQKRLVVAKSEYDQEILLDSRPRGRGFEPHRRHCVVVLEQDTFILA